MCLTDEPGPVTALPGVDVTIELQRNWPGWWSKLEALSIPGPCLYFDLDTMIVNDLEPWVASFAGMTERFGMLSDFYSPMTFQSGIMFWHEPPGLADTLGKALADGTATFRANSRGIQNSGLVFNKTVYSGDGPWIGRMVGGGVRVLNGKSPRRVVSYKKDVRGREEIPENACVVCFHGHPRPHEVTGDPLVKEHWR